MELSEPDKGISPDGKPIYSVEPLDTGKHQKAAGMEAGASEGVDVIDQALDGEEDSPASATIQKDFINSSKEIDKKTQSQNVEGNVKGNLQEDVSTEPSRTNSLVPPAPQYGPPTFGTRVQSVMYKISSSILSFWFLMFIIVAAILKLLPRGLVRFWLFITLKNHKIDRPFYEEEMKRSLARRKAEREWTQDQASQTDYSARDVETADEMSEFDEFKPTEGGQDRFLSDIGYYARRAGLDSETFLVQTEDRFILELFHLYNPLTTSPTPGSERNKLSLHLFNPDNDPLRTDLATPRQYPVLLIPGLLQSPGAYCCAGSSSSLAFFLARSGLDVWLGSNRGGFRPEHASLSQHDPRMWAWNLRHMGVLDLPALAARVLEHTGFKTLALMAHSQGTAETLVALAKQQRPEFGKRLSIACLLAPAAYAGPMLKRPFFKALRIVSPRVFRAMFGIHDFIPLMQLTRRNMPPKIYGALGYRVFNFLFGWSDRRWERELRDRFFIFSPTIVSAESMRWWLGREGFAREKCILQTKEEWKKEDEEDERGEHENPEERGKFAWYDERVPPMALWIAGSDRLVDGKRLLKRLSNGREPFVKVVHAKIIQDYHHLDVLWAVDVLDQVGKEVLDCIWRTIPKETRPVCKVPRGCVEEDIWIPQKA